MRSTAGAFCLLLLVGGLLFVQGYLKLHKVFKGGAGHAVALQAHVNPTLLKGEGDGRVNILLLGNGGPGHDGSDLTDTIMVESIDPVNNTATLLSVPRDLWVKMPNDYVGSMQKINAAYEAGKYAYLGHDDASNKNTKAVEAGFKAADSVVSEVLGIPINYNVVVNFSAFRQAINTVGGVNINVPAELYDPTMAWENHWNPVLAKPGEQVMSGTQALLYVRSRETSSDFARSQRQRAVLLALKDKILSAGTLSNPLKISELMSAFGDNMVTDISLSDATRMYDIMKSLDNAKIRSVDLVTGQHKLVTTANLNGISIDEPVAGMGNYSAIHDFVRGQLPDGYIVKEHARIGVYDGAVDPAAAQAEAATLKTYGYNIAKVGSVDNQTFSQTVVVDLTGGRDKYTQHYLENRFNTRAVSQLPAGTDLDTQGLDFIIVLGSDRNQSL